MSGIIYGLVARGTVVLAEYAKANGNFMQVCRLILQKIDTTINTRASYAYDTYFFHYILENGLIYMCMTDATLKKTIAYYFLDDIKQRFTSKYGALAADAPAYKFNDEFSRVLQTQSVCTCPCHCFSRPR
jgi:vesicle-associated membrane protein 7